jgi:hypothetical protein
MLFSFSPRARQISLRRMSIELSIQRQLKHLQKRVRQGADYHHQILHQMLEDLQFENQKRHFVSHDLADSQIQTNNSRPECFQSMTFTYSEESEDEIVPISKVTLTYSDGSEDKLIPMGKVIVQSNHEYAQESDEEEHLFDEPPPPMARLRDSRMQIVSKKNCKNADELSPLSQNKRSVNEKKEQRQIRGQRRQSKKNKGRSKGLSDPCARKSREICN